MNLNKYLAYAAVALLSFAANGAMAGSITGSAHDFSTGAANAWSGGRICVACHAPHGTDISVADAPLWNHANSTASYTYYSSTTMDAATPTSISGLSKLCLSCHDGTIAIDSFGGATGSTRITAAGYKATSNIGINLKDDHPVGIDYTTATANLDGALHNPASKTITIGSGVQTKTGTIQSTVLYGNKLECSSCHDVHNTFTADAGAKLVKVSQTGSQICLACHNK